MCDRMLLTATGRSFGFPVSSRRFVGLSTGSDAHGRIAVGPESLTYFNGRIPVRARAWLTAAIARGSCCSSFVN